MPPVANSPEADRESMRRQEFYSIHNFQDVQCSQSAWESAKRGGSPVSRRGFRRGRGRAVRGAQCAWRRGGGAGRRRGQRRRGCRGSGWPPRRTAPRSCAPGRSRMSAATAPSPPTPPPPPPAARTAICKPFLRLQSHTGWRHLHMRDLHAVPVSWSLRQNLPSGSL